MGYGWKSGAAGSTHSSGSWWHSEDADSTVSADLSMRSKPENGTASSWYSNGASWWQRPQREESRERFAGELAPEASPAAWKGSASGESWWYHGAWWWNDSDRVHRNHLEGRRTSYYPSQEIAPAFATANSNFNGREQRHPTGASTVGAHDGADESGREGHLLLEVSATRANHDVSSKGGYPVGHSASSHIKDSRLKPVASRPPSESVMDNFYSFVSFMSVDLAEQHLPLPPMSLDGGNVDEFQEYWMRNTSPRRLIGGWVERVAHPQVNVQPYWYNERTGETVWKEPHAAEDSSDWNDELQSPLRGEGPAWEMSIKDLKRVLRDGQSADYGLSTQELARRAVAEFEKFLPRVLSWHDYQYICFWFFGGLERKEKDFGKNAKSFFSAETGASRDLFADDAFFHAAAKLMMGRLHLMHPINLTYFIWTCSRAEVIIPELMEAVGTHFCNGMIPMCDRCSLGTMVWNYSKQGIRHDRFFEDSAAELSRPNRLRSLAPRNFQNCMIAYSRRRHWNDKFVDAMARGIPRLLDNHDPRYPKTVTALLFSYTCKDGSEVEADAFRIGGTTVVAKALHELRATGPEVERCMASMLDYVIRSVERSPPMMREAGDACSFVRQLAYIAEAGRLNVISLLQPLDFARICQGAPEKNVGQMKGALRRCGIYADV